MGKPKGIPRQTLVDTAKKAVNMKTHTWNCESRQGTVKSVRDFDDMDEPVNILPKNLNITAAETPRKISSAPASSE